MAAKSQHMHACKMCRKRPAGARSHILARAQIRDVLGGGGPISMIPQNPLEPERQRQSGPFDTTILCIPCEEQFQIYDKHGVEALRREPVPWLPNGVQRLPDADARLLKLYFMHVLWRAHESTLPEMVGTDLREGGRARRLRELLMSHDAGSPSDFAVHLSRFDADPDGLHGIVTVPQPLRWVSNLARAYEFNVGLWRINITTAAGGPPREIRDYAMMPGKPVPVLTGMPYRESSSFSAAIETMQRRLARPGRRS